MAGQQTRGPTSSSGGGYVPTVRARLSEKGFTQRADGPEGYTTTVFHRRGVSLKKMGYVDTFVVIAEFDSVTPERAEEFSKAAFKYGLSNKSLFPRWVTTALVVYPVIVGENFSQSVVDWVESYNNTHFGAFEFTVAVDPTYGETFYLTSKPWVGRIHYGDFQQFADDQLGPSGDTADGDPYATAAAERGPRVNYCPSCGSEITHDADFCGSCGTQL
jgi:hypothetical protein